MQGQGQDLVRSIATSHSRTVGAHWINKVKRIGRMSGFSNGPALLFCHIPKCAGTSLREIVQSEYRRGQALYLYGGEVKLTGPDKKFLEEFQRIRRRVQIVYGHFSFGVHRALGVPPLYATIVREPISRVVSLYHHIVRDPTSPFFAAVSAGLPLKDFVGGRFSAMTNNHMTRIVAGVAPEAGTVRNDIEMLEQAKENIEEYFCAVGTTEAMDRVVRKLGELFAWRDHATPRLNVAPLSSHELDKETLDVIVEHNQLDLDLYQWVAGRQGRSEQKQGP